MYSYVVPYYVSTGHAGSAELFVIISRTAWFSENMSRHKIHTNFPYNSWDIYRTKVAQQRTINLRRSACSVIFLCPKLNLVERDCLKKKPPKWNFTKIRSVADKLPHVEVRTERQKDTTQLTANFRYCLRMKAPKTEKFMKYNTKNQ
jgi:hypothetical protein